VSLFPARATITPPAQVPVTRFFGALVASRSVVTLWIIFTIPWILVAVLIVLLLHATGVRETVSRWMQRRRSVPGDEADNLELPDDERRVA
jgi:type III secretion protein J